MVVVVVDWLQLPDDLTAHIISKLISISDYARLGAVCVKWRSIFHCPKFQFPRQLPLLVIPTPPQEENDKNKKTKKKKKNKNEKTSKSCSFYRITDGKIYDRLHLTMPRERYVRGSSHGWLITVDDELIYSAQLMNPFYFPNTATKEIKLPPLTAHPFQLKKDPVYRYGHLQKAVLSVDPASNPMEDVVVMAIFGDSTVLSFCKPGDEAWTLVKNDPPWTRFVDVIYYENKFYALSRTGSVFVCDVEKKTATTVVGPPVTTFTFYMRYLVESLGEVFQVLRDSTDGADYVTDGFKVFKLLSSLESTQRMDADWVEVTDLCGCAFFVGDNASMSIPASDFPGCKPNCIYYTDDYDDLYIYYLDCGPHDMGVFNLENGSFEKHYPTDVNVQLWPSPIWIEPALPRLNSIARSKGGDILSK